MTMFSNVLGWDAVHSVSGLASAGADHCKEKSSVTYVLAFV